MIVIYWTKRVLCYYYVLTYWQRGWWNCCRSSEAASVKYSCFSNFRNPKIGISSNQQNLVNIPPKKWCIILHPKWSYLYMPSSLDSLGFHFGWKGFTQCDYLSIKQREVQTLWLVVQTAEWENQQQKRTAELLTQSCVRASALCTIPWRTMYDFHNSTDTLKFWSETQAINKTFLFFIWFWWNLVKL